jgi:GNAT superfamily N-acetyltransferase
MIIYREVSLQELTKRIAEIDVSEHGTVVYYWIESELKSIPEEWDRPKRTSESWLTGSWTTVLNTKGVRAWGAFEVEQFAGFILYRPHLMEDTAQLAALFTNRVHRRQGIASHLTRQLVEQAKADGHSRLYVSATPSESAVNFYILQGFVPTQQVHPELYELEPEDIHMIKTLS